MSETHSSEMPSGDDPGGASDPLPFAKIFEIYRFVVKFLRLEKN
jgi:hypothetical protein